MKLIDIIKQIEKLVCQNYEDLEIDDPIKEGYYNEYQYISGASDNQITTFENHFQILIPKDIKQLYQYKNGSQYFYLLFPNDKCDREFKYQLLSLDEIIELKTYFQNKDVLLREFYAPHENDYTDKLRERMKDQRIKPYLFHKQWIPFAKAAGDVYLMMDFDPDSQGTYGQIICYIHDPDEIAFVASTITNVIYDSYHNINFNNEGGDSYDVSF